jgi:hypothetical protein
MNFNASMVGFQPANDAMPGLLAGFTTPDFSTTLCVSGEKSRLAAGFRPLPGFPVPPTAVDGFRGTLGTAGDPVILRLKPSPDFGTSVRLVASPAVGPAPLPVIFTLVDPANQIAANSSITWNFGDGSPPVSLPNLFATFHSYATVRATGYLAQVTYPGGSASIQIYPMASPGVSPYSANLFQVSFSSGGTVPANLTQLITGINNTNQAQFADLLMIQHVDCASFDIDRAPYTTVGNRAFNADGFTNGMPSLNAADFVGTFKGEDSNYQVDPGTGNGQWDQAAQCGYFIDDDNYDPHPKVPLGDCALPHFRMVCNVGPVVLPVSADLVLPAGTPLLGNAADPPDDGLADGIAKNRQLKLVTGPLAWSWQEGGGR